MKPCPPQARRPNRAFDTTATYVRVTGQRPDGFVEFDFAIGEPEIFVELILPPGAFAEFCEANTVTVLEPVADNAPDSADTDSDPFAWRLADARLPTPN